MSRGRDGTAVPPSFFQDTEELGRSSPLGRIFLFSGMAQAIFPRELIQLTAHGQLDRLVEKLRHSLLTA